MADIGEGVQPYLLCLMTTSSMTPVVERGDMVLIAKAGRLAAGDLLLLPGEPGRPNYGHRLIRTFERGGRRFVLAKGDGALNYDPAVPVEAVLGRAAFLRRSDGTWFSLRAPSVRIAAFLAAWLFRAILFLRTEDGPGSVLRRVVAPEPPLKALRWARLRAFLLLQRLAQAYRRLGRLANAAAARGFAFWLRRARVPELEGLAIEA